MKTARFIAFFCAAALVCACRPDLDPDRFPTGPGEENEQPEGGNSGDNGDNGGNTGGNNGGNTGNSGFSAEKALEYLYDGKTVPEFHISVTEDEWNRLLKLYDQDNDTAEHIHANLRFVKGDEEIQIADMGLRLKGNTSRRRPEGNGGEMHRAGNTDWHHCHYQLNFTKYNKDDAHELNGTKKVHLKWFKDDATYVRELFCYDLFRRVGIWTAPHSAYCRVWIKVDGDPKETYLGVYAMIETVDGRYANARKSNFGSKDGYLWKCTWGASLSSASDDLFGNDGSDKPYELKTQTDEYDAAKAQLQDFIKKVSGKGDASFYTWIKQVCDVELLLKTYAVNVAVGMWDDYWKNRNNYYIYFNAKDMYEYKFFFIPYDYDNTLGTSSLGMDSGRQNPLEWGDNSNPLIYKMLRHEEFRAIYKKALLELVDPAKGEMYYTVSMARIRAWHNMIGNYVSNDTGEDMVIEDKPASWGNHGEYRLLDENNNYFKIKTESINKYCK